MKATHVLPVLALAILAGVYWLMRDGSSSGAIGPAALGGAPATHGTIDEPIDPLQAPEVREEGPAAPERTEVSAAPVEEEVEADAWVEELGGLTGRVVEEDGTPVPDISVALAQLDASLMLASDWAELGEAPPDLVAAETRTDEEGRFKMRGAHDHAFQGLGIDLGGPRATLRVVDSQLHHGETTDVGDIVLKSGCDLSGRIIDESGNGVPGVRVRVLLLPSELDGDLGQALTFDVQEFRADSSVGITSFILNGGGPPVVEAPPVARQYLDRLPIPTTHTDREGRYELTGIPLGPTLLGFDKAGQLGGTEGFEATPGELILDDKMLRAGNTVRGIVIDEEGEPLSGIEVMAGTEVPIGEAAILQPAGLSRADGSFEVHGLPLNDSAIVAARRSPDEPWIGAVGSVGEEIEIELEASVTMTVRVNDAAGEPVRRAKIEVTPKIDMDMPDRAFQMFMRFGAPPKPSRFTESEPGVYVSGELSPGEYSITARAPGYAAARGQHELWSDEREVTLVCEGGKKVQLKVVDATTLEPVANARASLVAANPSFGMTALAVGRTDAEGVAMLGPYGELPKNDSGWTWFEGVQILVQHPRYSQEVVPVVDGVAIAEARLRRGGELKGTIRWGSAPPEKLYMLILENREGVDGLKEVFTPPRLGHTDLSGAFRFTKLPPGKYRLGVYERYFDEDPIPNMFAGNEPIGVHREEDVHIDEGGTTEVSINLDDDGLGQTSILYGTIAVDGRPVAGATIRVNGDAGRVTATADEFGYYETPPFVSDGSVYVRINGRIDDSEDAEEATLFTNSVEVAPQSRQAFDLEMNSRSLVVEVREAGTGRILEGARVNAQVGGWSRRAEARTTDASGQVRITFIDDGNARIMAEYDGYSNKSVSVDDEVAGDTLVIELLRAVPCAGLVDLTALDFASMSTVYLNISGEGLNQWDELELEDVKDDGVASFSVDDLGSGHYTAQLYAGRMQARQVEFDLPDGGSENLNLVFQSQE